MSSYVLCIFEGKRAEPNITNNLCEYVLNEADKVILRASYGFNIYKLYAELEKDPFLDTFELIISELKKRQLTEKLNENELAVLEINDSSQISDIFLIFDYDAHCSNAKDEKLVKMLKKFSDSQDQGLLIISYPMVEAIRHQRGVIWREIVEQHLARAHYLIHDQLTLPSVQIESQEIFQQQLEKHIPKGKVAVISSFPLMLFNFYGNKLIMKLTAIQL